MDALPRDVRYAVRQLRRGRASTLISLLTVAVGIAVTTVMLSVVDIVLLRPLPYRNAERLVSVELVAPEVRGVSVHGAIVPLDMMREWQNSSRTFTEFAGHYTDFITRETNGEVSSDNVIVVTSNMFSFLGARPFLGRGFVANEDQPGSAPVTVLSYQFWRRNFGADSSAVGKFLMLSDKPYKIVGVMPAGFHVPNSNIVSDREASEFWIPIGAPVRGEGETRLNVIGTLAADANATYAQTELDRISATLSHPSMPVPTSSEGPAKPQVTQITGLRQLLMAEIEKPVLVLMGAVLSVVLIICANVAGMQLTRLNSRKQEFALRTALGASQRRIARLVFIENIILAIAGGALGLIIATATFPAVISLFGSQVPIDTSIGLDLRVLLMVVVTVALMGVSFGGVSAFLANANPQRLGVADGQSGSGTSRRRITLGNAIIVGEIALTMVMLGFTGLLTRSFLQLTQSDRGYEAHGVITTGVTMPNARTATEIEKRDFVAQILDNVRKQPGVSNVAASLGAPLTARYIAKFNIADAKGIAHEQKGQLIHGTIDYFNAVGMQLRSGRFPNTSDANQTLVIDEAARLAYFPDRSAIGQQIDLGKNGGVGTVVGVVGTTNDFYFSQKQNTRYRSAEPHIYAPFIANGWFTLVVRTNVAPTLVTPNIKRAIREYNPRVEISEVHELQEVINSMYSSDRMLAELSIAFAVLALMIAAGGLYAIISYGATQRIREFGIRRALGAQSIQITSLTLQRGIWLAVTGTAVGTVLTIASSRVVRSVLFEVSPTDPQTLAAAGLVLLAVAMLASWIPAKRATKVEVVSALRDY